MPTEWTLETLKEHLEGKVLECALRNQLGLVALEKAVGIALKAKEENEKQLRWVIGVAVSVLGLVEVFIIFLLERR